MASRAPNGSSISSSPASWASARASAARWRIPPESSWGRFGPKPSQVDPFEQVGGHAPAVRPGRLPGDGAAARRWLPR